MCGGVTAYVALKRSNVRPGQWVVLPGAGGGLGHFAVQYAKAMGMRVIAIDGGDEKRDLCKKLGAEEFIDFTKVRREERQGIASGPVSLKASTLTTKRCTGIRYPRSRDAHNEIGLSRRRHYGGHEGRLRNGAVSPASARPNGVRWSAQGPDYRRRRPAFDDVPEGSRGRRIRRRHKERRGRGSGFHRTRTRAPDFDEGRSERSEQVLRRYDCGTVGGTSGRQGLCLELCRIACTLQVAG
jgi:Zinc-binding dehydrogenase